MPNAAELGFRNSVQASLAKLDNQISRVLESLVTHKYPDEVFALSFEVFSDGFTSGFPVRAFFMDRTNTEYFIFDGGEAKYPSPVDPSLIEIECVYPEELEEELEVSSPNLDTWEIASDELIHWFAKHWESVDGLNFPLVATIAIHDSSKEFNLKSGAWQPSCAAF